MKLVIATVDDGAKRITCLMTSEEFDLVFDEARKGGELEGFEVSCEYESEIETLTAKEIFSRFP
jgi:hypothetical protein